MLVAIGQLNSFKKIKIYFVKMFRYQRYLKKSDRFGFIKKKRWIANNLKYKKVRPLF